MSGFEHKVCGSLSRKVVALFDTLEFVGYGSAEICGNIVSHTGSRLWLFLSALREQQPGTEGTVTLNCRIALMCENQTVQTVVAQRGSDR